MAKKSLQIFSVGQVNTLSGPDFFNAQIEIDGQKWAGNVEIHLKSSVWYAHNHEIDKAYDNVILHVVWIHDVEVFCKSNKPIPTLELSTYVTDKQLFNYEYLFKNSHKKGIACQSYFKNFPKIEFSHWIERLYFERLENKTTKINEILALNGNNWEATLFTLLARNFGTKINSDAFQNIAINIPYATFRKLSHQEFQLEAVLLGMAGILQKDLFSSYGIDLWKEYEFLKHKYELLNTTINVNFFKLRPPNFPTVRLSQLAALYANCNNLFERTMQAVSLEDFYILLGVQASEFWDTHYSFGDKAHKKRVKKVTKPFIDLIIINTIIPLKFKYASYIGKDVSEELLNLVSKILPEKNSIVSYYESIGAICNSGLQSQALLQLKSKYCDQKKCLHCAVGNWVLSQ